jgi:glycosyltransferase involved in cell wall biosynthesis
MSDPCSPNLKIHVVLVHTGTMINFKGGAEKIFSEMANNFIDLGFRVTAICCDPHSGQPGYYIRNEVDFINARTSIPLLYRKVFRLIRCFSINKNRRHFLRRTIDIQWKATAIKNVIRHLGTTNIFISYCPQTTYILNSLIKINKPLISMFHSDPSYFIENPNYEFCRKSLNESDVIQVLMPDYITHVQEILPNPKIVYIPNAVPQSSLSSNLYSKTIICVARINKDKRQYLIIEAFHLLKKQFPDWYVELWGDDKACEKDVVEVKNLIKNLDLENNIKLCGTTNEIPQKLANSSIFAFPSALEGFSLALTEAFSIGLPVVGCNDCPFVRSIIKNGINGLLSDPTAESFAACLSILMKDRELRMRLGTHGKEEMKLFSPNIVWEKWNALIKGLASNKNK